MLVTNAITSLPNGSETFCSPCMIFLTASSELSKKAMADLLSLDLVSKRLVTDQLVITIGYDRENLATADQKKQYHGEVTKDHYGREIPKHSHGTQNLERYCFGTGGNPSANQHAGYFGKEGGDYVMEKPQIDIDFANAEKCVKKLQMRIAKAVKERKWGKVKALQWTLTHSYYAKVLAVKQVTENRGKRTSGVDHELWDTPDGKLKAIGKLKRHGYRPLPLRRVYIPKKNGKLRPLSIPTMTDRAMQTLYRFALDPVAETTADAHSYGFRKGRCVQDAIEHCFTSLSRGTSPAWILEGDIKGCFDHISHEWLLDNIPMDKEILGKFLKSGFMDSGNFRDTEEGTPQGGTISTVLCNMALDGLESLLKERFVRKYRNGRMYNPKVNFTRYADDFIVTGESPELLDEQVKPLIRQFLQGEALPCQKKKPRLRISKMGLISWDVTSESSKENCLHGHPKHPKKRFSLKFER